MDIKNLEKINQIKEKYGDIVLNTAIVCLVEKGTKKLDGTQSKTELQNIDQFYDNLEKGNHTFPFSRDFAKQVLSCQYMLYELDTMSLLTYFQIPKQKEEQE